MPQPEDMINPTFIKKIKQTFSRQGPLNWHKLDHKPQFDMVLSQSCKT